MPIEKMTVNFLSGLPCSLILLNLSQLSELSKVSDNHPDKIPLESLMLNPLPILIERGKNQYELLNSTKTWEAQLELYVVQKIPCQLIDSSALSEEKVIGLKEYVKFFLGVKTGAISFDVFVKKYIQSPHLKAFLQEHHTRPGEKITAKKICSLLGESGKSESTFNRRKADVINSLSLKKKKAIPQKTVTFPERWNDYAKPLGLPDAALIIYQLKQIDSTYPEYFKQRVNDAKIDLDTLWKNLNKVLAYDKAS